MRHVAELTWRRTRMLVAAAWAFVAVSAPALVQAAVVPAGFTDSTVATGLSSPTAMELAPDGRIFVAEQGGTLRIIKNGALLATPFLTLSVNASGERGLIGVTLDPNFATNRFVYVYYTTSGAPIHNRISRFTASAGNPDVAAPTETILVDLDNLSGATNHNGGALRFGADGKLYAGVGDNANGANAQTLSNRLGKLLRYNADGSIPSDNPFFTMATGANRAIWATGLRNPYTFAFQPGTGRMMINDVGQNAWEEIDDGIAGANYGWPSSEGPTNCTAVGFDCPVYSYSHSVGGCAITGGAFYNPATATFPASYVGKYLFADFCSNWIRLIDPSAPPANDAATPFATQVSSPVDLRVAPDGSLYYLARGSGSVGRIQSSSAQPPSITQQPSPRTVPVGASATFTVSAAGSSPLAYRWQRDRVDIPGATSSSYTLSNAQPGDNGAMFRCVVTNAFGSATSNEALLTVTSNTPPTATIIAPAAGARYNAGQIVMFNGSGSDGQDPSIPAANFTWEVVFHHGTHTHPFVPPFSGATGGNFTIPNTGETATDVWYRVHLTVRDSGGLTHTATRDIVPNVATLNFATNPAGLALTLDDQPLASPAAIGSVVGMQRRIGASVQQASGGKTWQFVSWSDGGARNHTITTPAGGATYTATFVEVPSANVALASLGGVATASSSYSPAFPPTSANDGETLGVDWGDDGGWADGTPGAWPDSLQIAFANPQTINRVVVYTVQDNYSSPSPPTDTMTFTQYGITAFRVQAWTGSAWSTLGTVTGNNLVKRTVTFAPFTTDRIRIMVDGGLASYARITEVEAWTPGPAPATTTVVSSLNPSTVGQTVTFTATVTGNAPTGNVAFRDGANTIAGCSAVALLGAGNSRTAACSTAALAQGTHSITAAYAGDGGNLASTSPTLAQVVNPVGASVNVARASAGAVATASSSYSAAFPPDSANDGEAAGIDWGDDGGWADGTPGAWPDSLQIAFANSQIINRVVVYTVQDNYASPSPPTDTMTFTQFGITAFRVQAWTGSAWSTLATVTGNNLVKRTVTFAPFTTDRIRILVDGGLASYARITEVEAWTSGPAAANTTLASSLNPSTVGQTVTFTATVAGTAPTGNVAFRDGANTIAGCSAVALGGAGNSRTAACSTAALAQGSRSITAAYAGDGGNLASTSAALAQVVNPVGAPVNVARASAGAVASASSQLAGFSAASAIDGNPTGPWGSDGGWNDATGNAFPDWLQVRFNGQTTIDRVVVYTLQDNFSSPSPPTDTMTFTQYGITAFVAQAWTGSAWTTLATVTGNNLVKRTLTFAPFTTDRIRIQVSGALASYSRIVEVEAWTP